MLPHVRDDGTLIVRCQSLRQANVIRDPEGEFCPQPTIHLCYGPSVSGRGFQVQHDQSTQCGVSMIDQSDVNIVSRSSQGVPSSSRSALVLRRYRPRSLVQQVSSGVPQVSPHDVGMGCGSNSSAPIVGSRMSVVIINAVEVNEVFSTRFEEDGLMDSGYPYTCGNNTNAGANDVPREALDPMGFPPPPTIFFCEVVGGVVGEFLRNGPGGHYGGPTEVSSINNK